MKQLSKILIVCALLAFCPRGYSEMFYSFSFEGDERHKVEVEMPDGWENIERESESLYDLKFIDASGNQECMIFLGSLENETISQEYLVEAAAEIKKQYYGDLETRNHQMTFSSANCFQSFEVVEGESSFSVGLIVFPIKTYLFALTVKNRSADANPTDDCNYFIKKIKLFAQE